MPIKIDRNTGKILSAPQMTPEQNQKAWETIVKAYVKKHPEKVLESIGTEKNNEEPE